MVAHCFCVDRMHACWKVVLNRHERQVAHDRQAGAAQRRVKPVAVGNRRHEPHQQGQRRVQQGILRSIAFLVMSALPLCVGSVCRALRHIVDTCTKIVAAPLTSIAMMHTLRSRPGGSCASRCAAHLPQPDETLRHQLRAQHSGI